MFTMIQNINCYTPAFLGVKDIFIVGNKIFKMADPGQLSVFPEETRVISGESLSAFPGIIDGHVHIIGGGGEDGFTSRIGEIGGNDIVKAGITTVVGLLGADDQTKSLFALLAKAKSLEAQGVSTYIYSGSYSIPVVTFTGNIAKDILLIDKVIGAGEIAISDHRSSHPEIQDLLALAGKIHLSAMIADKAGLLHFHLGDGKDGLNLLCSILANSDFPPEMFLPTHVNRNPALFRQAIDYVKSGGYIDLTSGEDHGISLPDAVETLIREDVNLNHVTASSDANGSIPCGGIGTAQALFDDIILCITKKKMSPEMVFPLVTEHVAKRLKKYPQKGVLRPGSDADIMILNRNYELEMLFSMGNLKIDQRGLFCLNEKEIIKT